MDRGAWRTTVHRVAKSQTQLKRRGMHTELVLGFPGGSDGKKSVCTAGDQGAVPRSGRSPGEGNGYPHQHFCLKNLTVSCLTGYSP